MAEYVTLNKEEYDSLRKIANLALEQSRTLDMVLDVLKDNANSFDLEEVYVHSIESPEKLANIFRYRMPEEWHELETEVIEREKRDDVD
jgi:RNAse (barnase) inhibitor barstar